MRRCLIITTIFINTSNLITHVHPWPNHTCNHTLTVHHSHLNKFTQKYPSTSHTKIINIFRNPLRHPSNEPALIVQHPDPLGVQSVVSCPTRSRQRQHKYTSTKPIFSLPLASIIQILNMAATHAATAVAIAHIMRNINKYRFCICAGAPTQRPHKCHEHRTRTRSCTCTDPHHRIEAVNYAHTSR